MSEPEPIINAEFVETSIVKANHDLNIARPPDVVLKEAREAAKALQNVIETKEKKVVLNGKTYLTFEDWQTVGRFYGISVGVESTKYIEYGDVKGFESRAYALVAATGVHVSAAEGMCLNDEQNWKNKPLFQLRSMAQTRACAKALRNVLAFVPVLAGYEPTPAEEMLERGSQDAANAVAERKIKEAAKKKSGTINFPPAKAENKEIKAKIQKAEEKNTDEVSGMLESVEKRKGPNKEYLRLVISQPGDVKVTLDCFHNHEFADKTKLFDLLEMAVMRHVSLVTKKAGDPKWNDQVVRVLKIHTVEFDETGEPYIMREAGA